jgi:hypothetical protein
MKKQVKLTLNHKVTQLQDAIREAQQAGATEAEITAYLQAIGAELAADGRPVDVMRSASITSRSHLGL